LGWGEVVTGRLEVIDVPGDHLSILRAPLFAPVVARLAAAPPAARETEAVDTLSSLAGGG
jgi:thioesterase domain-containing protein